MDTIDYDKYYKRDNDGCYTVHFANAKKLSVDEIKEIFSAYGKVISVNITDQEYGFRFVKYKTLEEIICCLKGLKNSDIIQLLPEKIKMNDSNHRLNKYNSTPRQRLEYSFQKTFGDKQFNLNSAHNRKSSEIENSTRSTSTSNGSQFDNADNFSDTASRSSHNSKSNVNAVKYDKSDSLISNSLFSRQQNSMSNSSEINYYKYYKIGKDGTYIVHFANKKELSINEIRKLFSSYGNVVSVYFNEERISGLVFVRYRSLEETITCLKELQNNDMISILPQKDKINGTVKKTDQENSNHGQLAEMQDSFQRINRQFDSNSNYDKKFSKTEEKLTHNTTSDRNRFHSTNNFLNTDFESLNDDNKSAITYTHSDFLISADKQISSSQRSFNNYEVTNYNQEQQHKSKFHSFTKPDIIINVNKDVSDDKIPALISNMEIKQKQFDAVSKSSSQSRIKNTSSEVRITPMQEIIVADIHANYDVHYILHLFKKYNPISATVVETLETNKRYCHVYFKTIQDAVTVEEEFDNFDLSGKNLIVLRMSRLIEEVACK
ncbi:MATH and LRR domain-containing protein PFE0570w-like [Camponotus floridanus]|uniref:MATH and LRR domain-containing protein PFE0570w-like n=1 Tax=Camponotus floridanus TaxID=104421 RepID=UPI00059B942F|nr:MATH and LRR domain-containing protein PFE0570w-like [Camponotus floridanus]